METIELAKKLISFNTSEDSGKKECIEFIKRYLEDEGLRTELFESNGIYSLTCRIGEGKPVLCFNGHYDVVPANEIEWKVTKPYLPVEKAGKLYGRGASDMKTALAVMINTFIKISKEKFKGTIILMVVGDEEVGGFDGTGYISNKFKDIDYAIVGEPTDFNLKIARRGVALGTVKFYGKSGHASKPEEAKNVIYDMAKAVLSLSKLKMKYKKDQLLPKPTLSITIISSGEKQNVIPGYGEMKLDIRHVPSQNEKTIKNDIEKALNKLKIKYKLELKEMAKPFRTKRGKLIESSVLVLKKMGLKPRLLGTGGASDGRFLASNGAEVIECGLDENMHVADEFITIEKILKLEKFYYSITKEILFNLK